MPGRCIDLEIEDNGQTLEKKMQQLTTTFKNQMYKAAFLDEVIKNQP